MCSWWPAGIPVSEPSQAPCILIALSTRESMGGKTSGYLTDQQPARYPAADGFPPPRKWVMAACSSCCLGGARGGGNTQVLKRMTGLLPNSARSWHYLRGQLLCFFSQFFWFGGGSPPTGPRGEKHRLGGSPSTCAHLGCGRRRWPRSGAPPRGTCPGRS